MAEQKKRRIASTKDEWAAYARAMDEANMAIIRKEEAEKAKKAEAKKTSKKKS